MNKPAKESPKRPEVREQRPQIEPQYLDYIPDAPEDKNEAKSPETPLPAREDIYASEGKQSVLMEALDWIKYVLIAIILGLLLSYFVIQRSGVVGNSMMPTLLNADQLLVEKLSVRFSEPKLGSIITIDAGDLDQAKSGEVLVKRVIAVPGQTLDFKDGQVYIDGALLDEPYLEPGTLTMPPENWSGPQEIPADNIYVLGDNRAFSADSRIFGLVPMEAVEGHVLVRIYPFSRFGIPE